MTLQKRLESAYKQLKDIGCPVHHLDDRAFVISAEDNVSEYWADYYGELTDLTPYINPKIEEILDKHQLFAEWCNPGMLNVYDN